MPDKTYNGWRNYETWYVKLWLNNGWLDDKSTYEMQFDMAQEVHAEGNGSNELAKRLEQLVQKNMPDLGASMYAALLQAALDEVDWNEIAESIISDCEFRK